MYVYDDDCMYNDNIIMMLYECVWIWTSIGMGTNTTPVVLSNYVFLLPYFTQRSQISKLK